MVLDVLVVFDCLFVVMVLVFVNFLCNELMLLIMGCVVKVLR